jgi:signal transduction histidine kinase
LSAAAYGGWLAAAVAAAAWLAVQRVLVVRREAVTRACHELRGPLTAVGLALDLGCREERLSSAQLRAIRSELGRATLALEDLAGAPRGRTVPTEAAALDLDDLVEHSVRAWEGPARAAGVDLRLTRPGTDAPRRVRGDRLRLAQAVGNLIANAVEHGGDQVTVSLNTDATTVRLEVSDNGPGLPAPVEVICRQARQGSGGRGRGLAIAAGIARLHGGRLFVAPAEAGARLVLALPCAADPD